VSHLSPQPPVAGPDDAWFADLLGRCRFPPAGDGPVTLAVSGGADSMALTVLAAMAGLRGTVVHVDHGLRPGSEAEAAVVAEAAGRVGFDFRAERVSISDGPDLEARARRARYGVLPAGVLTGHTMDDQAETVLLNVLRGAALDGWAAMRGGPTASSGTRMAVRRPLLALRRVETAEVCRRTGIAPVQDPSNSDARYRRNRVRSELLPLLEGIAGRDVVPVLARQADLAAEDVELLDRLAAGLDPTDVAGLRSAPPALARRALRSWLRSGEGHHPPSSAEISRVLEVVEGSRRACELSGGRRVSRRNGRLALSTPGTGD
jgi:tRNA(Ile)-lysidine synthase